MRVTYSDDRLAFDQATVFLAGPTPRRSDVVSWRIEAVELLKRPRFRGTGLLPQRRNFAPRFDYSAQVEWEFEGLERCTVIAFWIPRDLDTLPGFTTTVEFGRYVGSGRCVYGRPDGAPHTRYLDWLYTKVTGRLPAD